MWPHERLQAYQRSLTLAIHLEEVARRIPVERRDLASQLRRASASIVLNVAEGADEIASPEKSRFFRIARRSGAECAAILDLLAGTCLPNETFAPERQQLDEVRRLLTGLLRRSPISP